MPDLEYASNHNLAERIQKAFRNAPEEFKRRHFPGVFGAGAVAAKPPKARPAPPRGRFNTRSSTPAYGFVVGSLAPGLSVPVHQALDGQTIPETFTRAAWRSMLSDVKEGRKVDLLFGHHGQAKASTADGTLRFENHDVVGLMFEARFSGDPYHAVYFNSLPADGVDVSVAFRRSRSKIVSFGGQMVRVIHSAELVHVALVEKGKGVGAYPAARAFPVRPTGSVSLRDAWTRAQNAAWSISKQSVRLTDLWSLE